MGRTVGGSPVMTALKPLTLVLVAFAGCSPANGPSLPIYELRDSAGIDLIQSGPPLLPDSAAWRVDPDPVLQIGEREGERPYLFFRLRDALRAPDGRIVVMEGETPEIRVFGPNGKHIVSFGGPGDGPREFSAFPGMTLVPPDTLLVWDRGHARLSWFDLEGSLLRQRSFPALLQSLQMAEAVLWQVRPDGAVLGGFSLSLNRGTRLRDMGIHIGLIDDAGETSHDFGDFPGGHQYLHFMGFGFDTWFSPKVRWALGPRPLRVAISSPDAWEIRFFSTDGQLVRILRAPIPRVEVTPEVRGARRSYVEDIALRIGLSSGQAADMESEMPAPDSLPAIAEMLWDPADHLWVGRRLADPRRVESYDVFEVDGHWITTVHVPQELGYLREIGEDYVLMLWLDDSDVEYLRLYRLEKRGL